MAKTSQLMNFCDPVFKVEVTCSTVSSEGYEATNLVSSDMSHRRRGFMADRFIKPPVEISFKFPFVVNISHIEIRTQVGQQKSDVLEIFSNYIPYIGNPKSKEHQESLEAQDRIAYVRLNNTEKGVLLYCPKRRSQSICTLSSPKPGLKEQAFRWTQQAAITNATTLSVFIRSTYGSSVPAIAAIEVWGDPSSSVSKERVNEARLMWKGTMKPPVIDDLQDVEVPAEEPNMSGRLTIPHLLDEHIPEEFVDAITYEIMARPMVLPSGKVVDERTLDQHAKEEAVWGRPPSDPFTGLPFGAKNHPVLDPALKARIDRFLILNQDRTDLQTIPRTVGRLKSHFGGQPHKYLPPTAVSSSVTTSGLPLDSNVPCRGIKRLLDTQSRSFSRPKHYTSKGCPQTAPQQQLTQSVPQTQLDCSVLSKETNVDEDIIEIKRTKYCGLSKVSVLSNKPNAGEDIIEIKNHKYCGLAEVSEDVHKKKLDDSLDSALKAALSSLPSFVNPAHSVVPNNECANCKTLNQLFLLPCKHFLCRDCLVDINKKIHSMCPNCNLSFKSCDPVRHHVT